MLKQVQYHPVSDDVIHVDLMRVRRSEKMNISVPILLVGESKGVKEGGILTQSLTQVEISCYPTDVPEQIELNIDQLELNSGLIVGDIDTGSEDIEVISDSSLNIVSIMAPSTEREDDSLQNDSETLENKDDSKEMNEESLKNSSDENKKPMIAFIGLGNIGFRYKETKHNAGFWVIDEFARRKLSFSAAKTEYVFTKHKTKQVLLVKPTTGMNRRVLQ